MVGAVSHRAPGPQALPRPIASSAAKNGPIATALKSSTSGSFASAVTASTHLLSPEGHSSSAIDSIMGAAAVALQYTGSVAVHESAKQVGMKPVHVPKWPRHR